MENRVSSHHSGGPEIPFRGHSDRSSPSSVDGASVSTIPKTTTLDREYSMCPGCYAAPFPTMWTLDYLGCVYCTLRIVVVQSEPIPAPASAQTPAVALDRPRSPKGKSPQVRGRYLAKTQPPTEPEFRCFPFMSSGNTSLPYPHISGSPPPDIAFLSRRFEENGKWESARKDAVTSFNSENCGCASTYLVSLILRFSPTNADPQFTSFR